MTTQPNTLADELAFVAHHLGEDIADLSTFLVGAYDTAVRIHSNVGPMRNPMAVGDRWANALSAITSAMTAINAAERSLAVCAHELAPVINDDPAAGAF